MHFVDDVGANVVQGTTYASPVEPETPYPSVTATSSSSPTPFPPLVDASLATTTSSGTTSSTSECQHPSCRRGSNQYATWLNCTVCKQRVATVKNDPSFAGVTAIVEDECGAYETADGDSAVTLYSIWDSGYRCTVAGEDVLRPIKQRLQELGFPLIKEPSTQRCGFGTQGVLTANAVWHPPCEIYGRSTILQACEGVGRDVAAE